MLVETRSHSLSGVVTWFDAVNLIADTNMTETCHLRMRSNMGLN